MGNYEQGAGLTGLGRGLGLVADRMYQKERDRADEYRMHRLALLNQGIAEKATANQQAFTAGQAEAGRDFTAEQAEAGRDFTAGEGVLSREAADERARLDREDRATNVGKTISAFDEEGNPITITIDSKGNEVRSDERGPTATEAAVKKLDADALKTKKDIKAAVWAQTKDELFSDEFAEYAAGVAKDGTMDINSFWAQFMDPETGFKQDAALAHMLTNNPEAHEKYTAKRLLMADALENGMNQSEALEYARQEYSGKKAAAKKEVTKKVKTALGKKYNIEPELAGKIKKLDPSNAGQVAKYAAGLGEDPTEDATVKGINPAFYEQMLRAKKESEKPKGLLTDANMVTTPSGEKVSENDLSAMKNMNPTRYEVLMTPKDARPGWQKAEEQGLINTAGQ